MLGLQVPRKRDHLIKIETNENNYSSFRLTLFIHIVFFHTIVAMAAFSNIYSVCVLSWFGFKINSYSSGMIIL